MFSAVGGCLGLWTCLPACTLYCVCLEETGAEGGGRERGGLMDGSVLFGKRPSASSSGCDDSSTTDPGVLECAHIYKTNWPVRKGRTICQGADRDSLPPMECAAGGHCPFRGQYTASTTIAQCFPRSSTRRATTSMHSRPARIPHSYVIRIQ